MPLKVGIKYCGGCNPTYHREDVEKAIRSEFKNAIFYYLSEKDLHCLEMPGVLVLINGCKKGCVSSAKWEENCESESIRIFRIDEKAELEDLISELREILTENSC